ncbi:MAG TPA: metal/formaldehyde-sensitive transcriptional repressor [Steroidobacteraceae bacterium]|jgi:DNA-binding FrmR family transcriptional regulator|nr:metal/formaldehyde-sensitive transcriptional repressor [Steroidobacteraceae bacterium]
MAHAIRKNKALLARVRRIKGQVAALENALERKLDCAAVLQQTAAVRGAISGLMLELLDGHLREHVAGRGVDDRKVEKELEPVLRMLRTYLR